MVHRHEPHEPLHQAPHERAHVRPNDPHLTLHRPQILRYTRGDDVRGRRAQRAHGLREVRPEEPAVVGGIAHGEGREEDAREEGVRERYAVVQRDEVRVPLVERYAAPEEALCHRVDAAAAAFGGVGGGGGGIGRVEEGGRRGAERRGGRGGGERGEELGHEARNERVAEDLLVG